MLALELELLAGRYVATRYNDRTRAEWPPHPARLFSALVATHYAHEPLLADERAALEWLEQQAPPHLAASLPEDVAEREPFTVFVPVNDPTVVGSFDAKAQKLEEARRVARDLLATAGGAPKRGSLAAKALAQVEKLERALAEDMAEAVKPGKVTGEAVKTAERMLPESRTRQPRTFPSVCPSDPRVHFIWPEVSPPPEIRTALARLAERLVRLGHSSSLVRARLVDAPPPPTWRPDDTGEHVLRVVRPGQLQALDDAWQLHQETQPRVLPASFQGYSTRAARGHAAVPASHFADQWLVLRRRSGPSTPSTSAVGLASVVRRALMRFAPQPLPPVLSGHGPDGGPHQRPHLAVVPLPFVGHAHADGSALGVALVLPREASTEERRALFLAVKAWEDESRKAGAPEGHLRVLLGESGELLVERLDAAASQSNLRPETWCGPARRWLTATPIALNRNPGNLWSRDPGEAAKAEQEAVATLRAAVEHIGLPPPASVTPLRFAPLAGAAKARFFPRFPKEHQKLQRVLVHAEIEFDAPVRGPLLVGAGRYLGLGLLRPVFS